MENTKVIAVIPLYNESRIVPNLINKIKEWQKANPGLSANTFFYLFDDGSTDSTENIVKNFVFQSDKIGYVRNAKNSNYGGIINHSKDILREKSSDWVIVFDSDLTNPLSTIGHLFDEKLRNVDYVKFSRYLKRNSILGVKITRNLLSRTGNSISRVLTLNLVSDPTNGFRATRLEFWGRLKTTQKDFSSLVEELSIAYELNLRIIEIPTVFDQNNALRQETSFRLAYDAIQNYIYWSIKIGALRLKKILFFINYE